uniref:Uncharacterized protein n=1 Tax=Podoviridae sp. ctz6O13 TaxID=2827757 RepID=A0A8S5TKH1_9CAUD|nr:MAG TPA: hypothetical protein [Podoviridae sp. ctz6O13]
MHICRRFAGKALKIIPYMTLPQSCILKKVSPQTSSVGCPSGGQGMQWILK